MKIKRFLCLVATAIVAFSFSGCVKSVGVSATNSYGTVEYDFSIDLGQTDANHVREVYAYLCDVFNTCGYPAYANLSGYTTLGSIGEVRIGIISDESFLRPEELTLLSKKDGLFFSECTFQTTNPLLYYVDFYDSAITQPAQNFEGLSRIVAAIKNGCEIDGKRVSSFAEVFGSDGDVDAIEVKYSFAKRLFMTSNVEQNMGTFTAKVNRNASLESAGNTIIYTRRQPTVITWYVLFALIAGAFVVVAFVITRKKVSVGTLVDETETERKRMTIKKMNSRVADFAVVPPLAYRAVPDSDLYESVDDTTADDKLVEDGSDETDSKA